MAFSVEAEHLEKIEELSGKLDSNPDEDEKLMRSVLESDSRSVEEGKLVEEVMNRGIGGFMPDMMFTSLVNNYRMARQLYGEKIIRLLTGYESDYLGRNLGIPEFQKELGKAIRERIEKLQNAKVLTKEGDITEHGLKLASLVMFVEELDTLIGKGLLGERMKKEVALYGEKFEVHPFCNSARYKDIDIRKSLHVALRRSRSELLKEDLRVQRHKSKGSVNIIYAIDSSASMRGRKLELAKKAGVALAFKATTQKDKVGIISFGAEVKDAIAPTLDFNVLLESLTKIRAGKETDFVRVIQQAIELFPVRRESKHLILLTDALPTVGKKPEEETLEAVSRARDAGITISLVGISLDAEGKKLAEKIVEISEGQLHVVQDVGELDVIVLQDYYAL